MFVCQGTSSGDEVSFTNRIEVYNFAIDKQTRK
nr:MAG TPA: Translation initiation factor IF-2, mitochondrial initiation, initiation factor IF2 [Caudoviricetes sp.]